MCAECLHRLVLAQPFFLPGLLQNSPDALSASTPAPPPNPIHFFFSSQSEFLESKSDGLISLLQALPPHLG